MISAERQSGRCILIQVIGTGIGLNIGAAIYHTQSGSQDFCLWIPQTYFGNVKLKNIFEVRNLENSLTNRGYIHEVQRVIKSLANLAKGR